MESNSNGNGDKMKERQRILELSGLLEGLRNKDVPADIAKFFDELHYEVKKHPGFDMGDKEISSYHNSYTWSFRNFDLFQSRPGEEDDDDPDFTGDKYVQRSIDTAEKRSRLPKDVYAISIRPDEKSWLTVTARVK